MAPSAGKLATADRQTGLRAPSISASEARRAGYAAGAAQARQRVMTVLSSEHFPGRKELSIKLLQTDLSADQIVAALGAAPRSEADAMLRGLASTPNPDLGRGAEAGSGGPAGQAGWDRTFGRMGWK
jgi:hypothetical protein